MYINVQINLTEGDETPTSTPAELLTALGGNPDKDSISVSVSASHAPPPPEPLAQPAPPAPPEA
jgi:hypothetical protein